jgi:hypothetical protein
MSALKFEDLLAIKPPTSEVEVGGITFHLLALKAAELDELITRYPPPKSEPNSTFHEDMRYELVALCVTDLKLDAAMVKELFSTWGRADVSKLQDAVFALNWRGAEKLPL